MTPTKTVEEIAELILSEDETDQFKGEYYQVEYRFIKLNETLMMWDLGRLDPVPQGDRYIYGNTLGHMRNYLNELKNIAKANGIEL